LVIPSILQGKTQMMCFVVDVINDDVGNDEFRVQNDLSEC
jgi:hypothetical protein